MAYKRNLLITNNPVQLVDKSKFANGLVYQGVTITKNNDGSYTLNGTNNGSQVTFNFYKMGANAIPYYLSASVPIEHNYYTKDCYYDRQYGWLFYILEAGKTYSNLKIYPQIYDLTKTFGKGNEPTSVAAFKAVYPLDLYPYNPSNIITSYKKHLKISDVCQLLDKSGFFSQPKFATYNNDGTFTVVTNTVTDYNWFNYPVFQLPKNGGNHIYLFDVGNISQNDNVACNIYFYDADTTRAVELIRRGDPTNTSSGIISLDNDTIYQARFDIAVYPGNNPNNVTYKPQLYDLTEMYGAGNEPTTVEQFRQDFPEEMYPYSPRCWVTSYKTGLIVDNGKAI